MKKHNPYFSFKDVRCWVLRLGQWVIVLVTYLLLCWKYTDRNNWRKKRFILAYYSWGVHRRIGRRRVKLADENFIHTGSWHRIGRGWVKLVTFLPFLMPQGSTPKDSLTITAPASLVKKVKLWGYLLFKFPQALLDCVYVCVCKNILHNLRM